MRNRLTWSIYLACLLMFSASVCCSSSKNRTEERAKERVIQFIRLMSEDRIEEAEGLLSRELARSETRELFLNSYAEWQLKDSSLVINADNVNPDFRGDKNKVMVSVSMRNEKIGYVKIGTIPLKFEKGDWYIGG